MTTLKNKAEKLVLAMHAIDIDPDYYMSMHNAKRCALVAIDEIISELDDVKNFTGNKLSSEMIKYWEEVKTEIQKML